MFLAGQHYVSSYGQEKKILGQVQGKIVVLVRVSTLSRLGDNHDHTLKVGCQVETRSGQQHLVLKSDIFLTHTSTITSFFLNSLISSPDFLLFFRHNYYCRQMALSLERTHISPSTVIIGFNPAPPFTFFYLSNPLNILSVLG